MRTDNPEPAFAACERRRESTRRGTSWVARSPSCLIGVMVLLVSGQLCASDEIYFRAPLSGNKVTEYTVQLQTSRDSHESFQVPEQCGDLLELVVRGNDRWGGQLQKSRWWKVETDCRYYAFLTRFRGDEMRHDFVRDYDFRSVNLADLPLEDPCVYGTLSPQACPSLHLGTGDMYQLLGLGQDRDMNQQVDNVLAEGWSRDQCRLTDGIFRGQARHVTGKLVCRADPKAPGVRLIAVDYADVNGDGYRDAILRFSPLGQRAGRMPAVLPVCRKGHEAAFIFPGRDADEEHPAPDILSESLSDEATGNAAKTSELAESTSEPPPK